MLAKKMQAPYLQEIEGRWQLVQHLIKVVVEVRRESKTFTADNFKVLVNYFTSTSTTKFIHSSDLGPRCPSSLMHKVLAFHVCA